MGLRVSIPQSGFGAFEPASAPGQPIRKRPVSIPQSGFGAFELPWCCYGRFSQELFQSLSRDSGRLNGMQPTYSVLVAVVSIPQSGFGAFEPESQTASSSQSDKVSIPQSGFGAFEP